MVDAPNPVTVAAGSKNKASVWNDDVRDAAIYLNDNIGGFGNRNVLINSHMDIWQYTTSLAITSSATPQYHADQWCTRRSGATGATVTRETGPTGQRWTARIARDSGNSNTTAIETMQPLESAESYRLAGQTCQLKLNLKAGANFSASGSLVTVKVTYGTGSDQAPPASGWTGTTDALSTTQAITTTATDYTWDSISIPSSATQVQVYVSFTPTGTAGANDWIELSAAQLTVGKSAGWERLPYAQILARCQRFYRQYGPYGAVRIFAMGMTSSTTTAILSIPLGEPMRIAPTLTFSAANDFSVNSAVTSSAMASNSATTTHMAVITFTGTGMGANQGVFIDSTADTTNAAIYVSARL